ncbi:hypothetical protein B0H14DRAFT_2621692 [Mycena olivaceomarginata]|nr:hypothetical protein B0H14DRAFT_2621692 [Mycena olivaceomarginata]
MPPKKGPLWQFFHQGGTQNTSHYKAYCLGCIEAHHQTHGNDSDAIDVDANATSSLRDPSEQQWFKDGASSQAYDLRKLTCLYRSRGGNYSCPRGEVRHVSSFD